MKRNINKLFFGVLIAGALISFYACTNNHKEGDGHNHDTPSETSSDEHEEENAVTLTDEQIKTVVKNKKKLFLYQINSRIKKQIKGYGNQN